MNKLEEKESMFQRLNEKGYAPRLDDDGDLVFTRDGVNFWIMFDTGETEFYQLIVPGVDLFRNDEDAMEGNKTALQIVRRLKGVKAFLQGDTLLCFAVDIFCADFDALTQRLERASDACLLAAQLYWLERGRQTVIQSSLLLRSLKGK